MEVEDAAKKAEGKELPLKLRIRGQPWPTADVVSSRMPPRYRGINGLNLEAGQRPEKWEERQQKSHAVDKAYFEEQLNLLKKKAEKPADVEAADH